MLCPVAAMAAYLASRKGGPSPFFKFRDGLPLSQRKFGAKVREVLEEAGLHPKKYAGQNFRSACGCDSSSSRNGLRDEDTGSVVELILSTLCSNTTRMFGRVIESVSIRQLVAATLCIFVTLCVNVHYHYLSKYSQTGHSTSRC